MSSRDFGFTTLRNVTAYQPNNLFVPPNNVLITSTNGAAVFSDNINISTLNASTINVGTKNASTINASTVNTIGLNIFSPDGTKVLTITEDNSGLASFTNIGDILLNSENLVQANGRQFQIRPVTTNLNGNGEFSIFNNGSTIGTNPTVYTTFVGGSTSAGIIQDHMQLFKYPGTIEIMDISPNGNIKFNHNLEVSSINTNSISTNNINANYISTFKHIAILDNNLSTCIVDSLGSALYVDGQKVVTGSNISTVSSLYWSSVGGGAGIFNDTLGIPPLYYQVGIGTNGSPLNATLDVLNTADATLNVLNISSFGNNFFIENASSINGHDMIVNLTNNQNNVFGPSFKFKKSINFSSTITGSELGYLDFYGTNTVFSTVRGAYIIGKQNGEADTFVPTDLEFHTYTSTSGASRMIITNRGNVGIGTNTPQYTLEVNGTSGFSTLDTNLISSGIGIFGTAGFSTLDTHLISSGIGIFGTAGISTLDTNLISSGHGFFRTLSSTTYIRGVNNDIIVSNNSSFPLITNYDGSTGINIDKGASNNQLGLTLFTYNSGVVSTMTLTDTGSVGINNANPQYTLDVEGTAHVSSSLSTNTIRMTNGVITGLSSINGAPFSPTPTTILVSSIAAPSNPYVLDLQTYAGTYSNLMVMTKIVGGGGGGAGPTIDTSPTPDEPYAGGGGGSGYEAENSFILPSNTKLWIHLGQGGAGGVYNGMGGTSGATNGTPTYITPSSLVSTILIIANGGDGNGSIVIQNNSNGAAGYYGGGGGGIISLNPTTYGVGGTGFISAYNGYTINQSIPSGDGASGGGSIIYNASTSTAPQQASGGGGGGIYGGFGGYNGVAATAGHLGGGGGGGWINAATAAHSNGASGGNGYAKFTIFPF